MERVAWPQGIAPPVSTPIGWIRPLGVALLLQTLLIPTVPVHATVLTPYGVEGEAREGRVAAMPAGLPVALASAPGRHLVLMRQQRQLLVMEDGRMLKSFPVAVGMPGWETPSGTFEVLEKVPDPIWQHPESGQLTNPGPANPLGSRWIGFHRDCDGRSAWNGEKILDVKGCVVMGFHGTPHRWTVGHAVSHGCVRLYDEHVRELFRLVEVGTGVTVLP